MRPTGTIWIEGGYGIAAWALVFDDDVVDGFARLMRKIDGFRFPVGIHDAKLWGQRWVPWALHEMTLDVYPYHQRRWFSMPRTWGHA